MALATSTYIAAAAVAVAAGSAYAGHQQAAAAAEDQKDAQDIATNEQRAASEQQRRQQIREERVKRASIIQASQNTGVSSSSGELGSLSVLNTSTGISMSNIERSTQSAGLISKEMQSAAGHQLQGQNISAVGSVAGSIFGAAAPYAAKDLFGSGTVPADVGKTNSSKGIFGS